MKSLYLIPFLLFSACTSFSTPPTEYYHSVVRLEDVTASEEYHGILATGFAISATDILTAGHFCAGYLAAKEKGNNTGSVFFSVANKKGRLIDRGELEIVKVSEAKPDLCLLRSLNENGHGVPPLKIKDNDLDIETQTKIATISAPIGVFPVFREGTVIFVSEHSSPLSQEYLSLAVEAQPGSSGSPIIQDGKVIGVLVAISGRLNQSALAIPVKDIHKFLDSEK